MSTPILPVVLRGPGIFYADSYAYYVDQSGLKISVSRKTEKTVDDFFGVLDETSQGGPMVEISFTPTGIIRSLAKPFPYGPTSMVAGWYSGQSILKGACYWSSKAGEKRLWARGGIRKSPTLFLNPRKQIFGSMTFNCINQITVQPTDAAVLETISATAFADTTFDETKIVKDLYTASLGSRTTPYNAIGAREGFEIEPVYEMDEVPDFNVGVADILLKSVQWRVKFAPNNLTRTQFLALPYWEDTSAIMAGESVARGPSGVAEDLVIDSDVLTATLHQIGFVKAESGGGVKVDANGQIEGLCKMKFTTGVPQPLVTITIN
jgi:hypothetical protein